MKLQSAAGPSVPVVSVAMSIALILAKRRHSDNYRVMKQAKVERKTAQRGGAFKKPRLGTERCLGR